MIGHVANELRHHKFREDRMVLPADRHQELGALNTVVDGGHGPRDTNT